MGIAEQVRHDLHQSFVVCPYQGKVIRYFDSQLLFLGFDLSLDRPHGLSDCLRDRHIRYRQAQPPALDSRNIQQPTDQRPHSGDVCPNRLQEIPLHIR